MGDRRGAQRLRQKPRARRVCRNFDPGLDSAAWQAQPVQQPREPVLRMVRSRRPPGLRVHPEIKPRQHQSPLRRPRDRLQQIGGQPLRAGGARRDDRPRRRLGPPPSQQCIRIGGPRRLRLRLAKVMRQNARPFRRNMGEEGGHGFPVRGVAVGLERVAERVQRHPLPLAFVQQRGQRFRQRGAGCRRGRADFRAEGEKSFGEPGQREQARDLVRHRRPSRLAPCETVQSRDAGQKDGATSRLKRLDHRPSGAARIHRHCHARQSLGRRMP